MSTIAAKRPEIPPSACTELSGKQRQAIHLLIAGKSVTETAIAITVDRRTLQRWRSNNPHFQAEYNRQRTEIYESAQQRLHGLVHKAVDVLEQSLTDGNLQAAIHLLKMVAKPDAETDPEQLVRRRAEKMAVEAYTAEPFANVIPGNESVKRLGHDIAEILRKEYKVESTIEELVDPDQQDK